MKYHRIKCEIYKAAGKPWEEMAEELLLTALGNKGVVRLIFFTAVADNKEYLSRRFFLEQWVDSHFVSPRPLLSLVVQKPLVGELVLEVHSLPMIADSAVTIKEKFTSSVRYLQIASEGYREIMAGGLCADDIDLPAKEQSVQVFSKADEILKAEGMNFGDIVRQWNYLEGITEVNHGNQCYQDFNDVRALYYASSQWSSGYPAATGIGAQGGGIQIDFNAVSGDINVVPLDNDWQRAAHVYSDEVLISLRENMKKGTPKFERGKLLSDPEQKFIYISGTAAIRGEESIPSDDVLLQTRITVENIRHLIGADGKNENLPDSSAKLEVLRVYLKNEEDTHVVEEEMDKLCPGIPVAYLCADVCRKELLVEIEGIAYL